MFRRVLVHCVVGVGGGRKVEVGDMGDGWWVTRDG